MAVSRRSWLGWAVATACAFGCSGLQAGEGLPGLERPRRSSRGEHRPLKYYVLQVMGVSGQVTFEVCGDIELRARQRDYEEEFENAAKEWMKSKADAKRRKEDFKDAPPKGPKLLKRMEGSYKKEEDARAAAEKFQKQWDEALEKKMAKKEGTASEEKKE